MRWMVRLLAVTLVVGLIGTSGAQAVIQDVPQFTFSPHTRAQAGAGNAVQMTLVWLPPTFIGPTAQDKQSVTVTDLDGGGTQTFSAGPTQASTPLFVVDGRRYSITVAACQTATCVLGSVNTAQSSGTTRIDATPPTGTMQINGGALATNDRVVRLDLAAEDPLIGGVPGTSSGVSQVAVDSDGDGTTPCILFGPAPDASGCAVAFAPSVTTTIPEGDGTKTVGVRFGDGARNNTAPCPPGIFCATLLGSVIEGNASAPATDTILLDTVKPLAAVAQDRTRVGVGGTVGFDATASVDQNPATASGADPATASWDFKDGSPPVTGTSVSHAFTRAGTFVGEMRVRDRAGNVSDARSFTVIVDPPPGAAGGGGSVSGVSGTADFRLDRLRVRARYVRSRLKGSIILSGSSVGAGALRAEIRRTARGRVVGRVATRALRVGTFTRTLKLPPTLLPGSYRLAFVGPGGTLSTTLRLAPPREGVIRSGRIRRSASGASVLFRLAARPARSLRGRLVVSWSQGPRRLGTVSVRSGTSIRAALPAGATLARGRLRAELRAGRTIVGSTTTVLR